MVTEALELFVLPAMVFFMVIFIRHFYLVFGIGILTIVVFTIARRLILKPPPKNQRPKAEDPNQKEGEKDITAAYIAVGAIFIFLAGGTSIDIQNHEKPDSQILFRGDEGYINVNILASNSNSIAYWQDGELYIAPRSEVQSVKYQNPYIQHLHSAEKSRLISADELSDPIPAASLD